MDMNVAVDLLLRSDLTLDLQLVLGSEYDEVLAMDMDRKSEIEELNMKSVWNFD